MTSRKWFSLKKFLPPSLCYQQEAPAPWSQSMILLWGGGTRHPGFFQAFPTKIGGPRHSSLKTSVLKVVLSTPPPISGALSRGIRQGAAEPTSLAVKAGGPEHARATA